MTVCLLTYSNTFDVPFTFDDRDFIVNNPAIKDPRLLMERPGDLGLKFDDAFFRSRLTAFFSFALNYQLHGLNVRGYHVVNLMIHSANSLLLYLLILISFRVPSLQSARRLAPQMALIASLLFALHPLQTEAVTFAWQRVTSLATFFYMASLIMYVYGRLSPRITARTGFFAMSLLTAVLAMTTKEISFTLPLTATVYEFLFLEGGCKKRLPLLLLYAAMLIVPFSHFDPAAASKGLLPLVDRMTRSSSDLSRSEYLFTEIGAMATYLRLIFLPVNQNLDYDFPLRHDFFSPAVFCPLIVLTGVLAAALLSFRMARHDLHLRLAGFGILWFFATISIESSVLPIADVFFEHRMYLPSAGLFVSLAAAGVAWAEGLTAAPSARRLLASGTVLVIVSLGAATYGRNDIWKDEMTLWEDVVKKSPQKLRAHNNLGKVYLDRTTPEKAFRHFQYVLGNDPGNAIAHNGLGLAYNLAGDRQHAVEHFEAAAKADPAYLEPHFNLGVLYMELEDFGAARKEFETATRMDKNHTLSHYFLNSIAGRE